MLWADRLRETSRAKQVRRTFLTRDLLVQTPLPDSGVKMSRSKLTYWQRRRLHDQLKAATEARVYRRALAVLELDRGRPAAEIAEMLGVTRQSIYNWADDFARDPDPESLADDPRGGRPRLLDEPAEGLLRSLMRQSPQEFGHPDTDWS